MVPKDLDLLSLDEENSQVLNLAQAMTGSVTPSLCRATLELTSLGTVCLCL